MGVAGCGAVGNHADRLARRVGGIVENLDVEHCRQATQALRADTQCIRRVEDLDAQLFDHVGGAATLEFVHVDGVHQRFFRQDHRLFGAAADADAEHTRWAPAGPHGRQRLDDPVGDRIRWVQHREFGLVLRAAAFGSDLHFDRAAGDQIEMHDGRRIVVRVLALPGRVGDDRSAQNVVGVRVGAPHTFVDHVGQPHGDAFPAHVHADLDEGDDDARILADRPMTFGAHARIGENLRDRVLRRRRLLGRVRSGERLDVVDGVIVGDVLQRVGDARDEIFLPDGRHDGVPRLALAGVNAMVRCRARLAAGCARRRRSRARRPGTGDE